MKTLGDIIFAHTTVSMIMIIALLVSLIIFPFQMTKVVAAEENENELNAASIVAASATTNSTQVSTSSTTNNRSAIPEAAKGPTIPPEKGYLVQEIRGGLYWVTDGSYNTMFMVTDQGVVAVDAPPAIGANYLKAIAEVTDKPIKYVIYSHSHLDHIGAAASIFPENATYIAQQKVAEELRRAHKELQTSAAVVVGNNNSQFSPMQLPAFNVSRLPPIPTVTFDQNYTLQIGNQTLQLNYYGNNHEEGNIFIYAPAQRTLMLVDIIFPGWVPFPNLALAEDVFGYIKAHDIALNNYDFDTFVGGHLTRLGTREDVQIQREFIRDLINASNRANQNVTFSEVMQKVGGPTNNLWAIFKTYLDTVAQKCTDEMLPKWQARLGGAQEFMFSHCWTMTESLRIDPSTKTLQQQQQ